MRSLDKRIASLARFVAKSVAMDEEVKRSLNESDIERILGNEKMEPETYENNETAGVVSGLAWSPMGGSVLFVESKLVPGKGQMQITGQLGEVMKESVLLAKSYLKAHADYLDIDLRTFDHWDIHVHFPAGAIPKDGPSAGIAILTSLASLFTQKKVRSKLAMTGEITLRGKVLPVGGIKEKLLAAKRAGITEVILCEQNRKDVEDIESQYLKGVNFTYVNNMLQVLDRAILDSKVKNPINLLKPVLEAQNSNTK